MPGTTRYSATFDCPYEESHAIPRRSRSQSWQANLDVTRPCGPLLEVSQRSSSSEGARDKVEFIPTRTVTKTVVKTHNNPFQFVKVGSSPLYKKAAEQLKKTKEVKKPEVLKEEEEWQTNLDSWKSRRRKMSEDVFKRQEEIRQFEQEEQNNQLGQKKIKTFSEMVESRASRGRSLSLCLISSPLDLQKWEENNNGESPSHLFSEGSEENSAVNSEDELVNNKRTPHRNETSIRNGHSKHRLFEAARDGLYTDSGLESISSGHRTADNPDSCSDFSSGSSIDCDSPRMSGLINGENLLEEFECKQISAVSDAISSKNIALEEERNKVLELNGESAIINTEQPSSDLLLIDLSLKEYSTDCYPSQSSTGDELEAVEMSCKQQQSIESENEVFVDDVKKPDISVSEEKNKAVSFQSSAAMSLDEEEELNIVFSSQPHAPKGVFNDLLSDVLPVEKVAEEMEKLILQQLEEEECAKELAAKTPACNVFGSPDHNLTAPPRILEPPKEKPPPPPCIEKESPKGKSLKRINSTKRIKKEISLRRSNFLGIENAEENGICDTNCVPRPPDLEQILKAEMELERENRKRLEMAATQRLQMEEMEEINLLVEEEQRIQKLREEKKVMEEEAEIQRQRLADEKLLKEREEYIRKQEVADATALSEAGAKPSNAAFLSNSSLGDGETVFKMEAKPKPAVPPKPLKKKEAIRRERDRLRQEQEVLQREREEHRRLQEQHLKKVPPPPPQKPSFIRTNAFPSQSSAAPPVNGKPLAAPGVPKLHKPIPAQRKGVPNESWAPLKAVKKGEYNQNHWLIQEAEMRRMEDRSRTHLAEDDVCRLQSPVQEKLWKKPALSVSGKKRCSHCSQELGRGAAMIIESLQLYYHIHCFQCCVCEAQLGNGSCGTDVRVRNNKLHCHNCYSNDEAGLKFSQV